MELKTLQEMIELNEADVIDSFKKGYTDAKDKVEKIAADAEEKRQKAILDAEEKRLKTIADAKQKFKKDVSKVEADVKPKKVDPNAPIEYANKFLDKFFTKFPQYGSDDDAQDILTAFPDRASLHAVFTTFKKTAVKLEALRNGFNKGLLASGKISSEQLTKYNQQARVMAGAKAPSPPPALVRFVKNESKFFKRMVNVNDSGELNVADFKELLQLKIKQTAVERVPDAAQALNMLFGYMTSEFKKHSIVIKDTADNLVKEIRNTRKEVKPEIEDPTE